MSQSSSTSLRLLEQARNGNADSLGLLLRKYFRYLNSLSQGHIDQRIQMRVSPSDIVQETLLEAHRDFKNFVGTSLEEFTGWLRKILFNNLATAIESHLLTAKRDVRKQRSLDEQANSNHTYADFKRSLNTEVSSPSSPLRRDEWLHQLSNAINQLPELQCQVIRMRHFDGLSFNEIATKLGKSPGATRMLWVRAVEKLKNVLPTNE